MGDTRVICTAKLKSGYRRFCGTAAKGWITAEYGMLPGSPSSASAANRRAARLADERTKYNG